MSRTEGICSSRMTMQFARADGAPEVNRVTLNSSMTFEVSIVPLESVVSDV